MSENKVKEKISTYIPVLLLIFFSALALIILPQDCSLFGNAEGPFSCDAIPNNCCKDTGVYTLVAQIIFCVGIGLTVGTAVYFSKKSSLDQNQSHLLPRILE